MVFFEMSFEILLPFTPMITIINGTLEGRLAGMYTYVSLETCHIVCRILTKLTQILLLYTTFIFRMSGFGLRMRIWLITRGHTIRDHELRTGGNCFVRFKIFFEKRCIL